MTAGFVRSDPSEHRLIARRGAKVQHDHPAAPLSRLLHADQRLHHHVSSPLTSHSTTPQLE